MKSKTNVKTHKKILSKATQKQQNKQPLSKQTILKKYYQTIKSNKKNEFKKRKGGQNSSY